MSTPKVITVVHPDSQQRVLLRSVLQARGLVVVTDHSCRDLLGDSSDVNPGVILIERSALGEEGLEVLSQLRRKWTESEIVFLPERLDPSGLAQLILNIDRLLGMRTTQDLLAV